MSRRPVAANRAPVRLAAVILAALAVTACGSTVTPAPSPAPSATAAASTGASPTAGGSAAVATAGSTGSSIPTSAPSTALPPATPTVAPEPSPSGAFACGYPYERAATRSDPVAQISDVRVGAHDTYDRVVFELLGTGTPRVRLERVTPPFVKDPSGLPLTVVGSSFVKITLFAASGGGYSTPTGQPTYTGPALFNAGYVRLTALAEAGDFEGITTWYAGLAGPMCYQVFELGGPARLVIDLRAP